jgi:hypothetical protein
LVDSEGRYIGVNTLGFFGGENVACAVPAGDVKGFLQDNAPPELKKELEKIWAQPTTQQSEEPTKAQPPILRDENTKKSAWSTPMMLAAGGGCLFIVVVLALLAFLMMRRRKSVPAPMAPMAPMPQPMPMPQPQVPATMMSSTPATMISPTPATMISGAGAGSVALHITAPAGERDITVALPATAGRSPECAILIDDSEVSRKHFELSFVNGQLSVTDLGSRNGTMLNGARVSTAALNAGDRIKVGTSEVTVQ